MKLKTDRLLIEPLKQDGMVALIGNTNEDELRKAYGEMLKAMTAYPKQEVWYTNWNITHRITGAVIGGIGFKGSPNKNHEVEVGFGIYEPFRGQGYASEALKGICKWAFSTSDCYFIQAQTEGGNYASQKVLDKANFKHIGEGQEGKLYEIERPKSLKMLMMMFLYICVGISLGISMHNIVLGVSIGITLGISIGTSLEAEDKKKRRRVK